MKMGGLAGSAWKEEATGFTDGESVLSNTLGTLGKISTFTFSEDEL